MWLARRARMALDDPLLREAGIPSGGPSGVHRADNTLAVRVTGTLPAEVLEAFRVQTGKGCCGAAIQQIRSSPPQMAAPPGSG